MLSFSPEKLFIVLVVALILLGPDKLPTMARQLGAAWRHLVELQQRVEREVRETMPDLPSSQDIARFARSPVTLLTSLSKLPEDGNDASDRPGGTLNSAGAATRTEASDVPDSAPSSSTGGPQSLSSHPNAPVSGDPSMN